MTTRYLQTVFSSAVKTAQTENGSRAGYSRHDDLPSYPDTLSPREAEFISARDSIYMASIGHKGWPYLQHRGGPKGFVKVLSPGRLGFADYRGNRQYVSLGNASVDPRVSLFFMDYPQRARLKLLGRMRTATDAESASLSAQLNDALYDAKAERLLLIDIEAFDWNCPQHIVPRYTLDDIEPAIAKLRVRIAELEAELQRSASIARDV